MPLVWVLGGIGLAFGMIAIDRANDTVTSVVLSLSLVARVTRRLVARSTI